MRSAVSGTRLLAVTIGALVIAGCGRRHYLDEYAFAEKTLAVTFIEAPSPVLLTGLYDLRPSSNPIQTVMRVGGGAAKEVEARRASAKLDTAVRRVDIQTRLSSRTAERAGLYLGTRPVSSTRDADFVLELHMKRFGIDARSNRAVYLFTRAEAVLLDRRTGREIWSVDVESRDRMTPYIIGTRQVPSSIFTAATLHQVTTEDFRAALEQLVNSSSNAITARLRDKLREAREERGAP